MLTIASAAKRFKQGTPWEIVSKELRNTWHEKGSLDMIIDEPELLGDWRDAFLAGLAEEMARSMDWVVPEWCNKPERDLKSAVFINCPTPLLRSLALVETGIGFRRHNLFVGKLDVRAAGSGRFRR